jgi:DNA-binding NtrC family response regulator
VNELILLVDDEPSIIKLVPIYLEREGFLLESANDGEAAPEMKLLPGWVARVWVGDYTGNCSGARW